MDVYAHGTRIHMWTHIYVHPRIHKHVHIFSFYSFKRGRERARVRMQVSGGRERGNPTQAPHCQHRARRGTRTHEPRDHDLSRTHEPRDHDLSQSRKLNRHSPNMYAMFLKGVCFKRSTQYNVPRETVHSGSASQCTGFQRHITYQQNDLH